MHLPQPKEKLEVALRRLISGAHAGGRWGNLSFGEAQIMLEDAIEELMFLRSETREWFCQQCGKVWMYPAKQKPLMDVRRCETCDYVLAPHGMVLRRAYEREVDVLRERVELLEEVARSAYDLTD